MKSNKGLSTVVTSLIIVLLVLVAIGIIWVVIRNVIEEGTAQIDVDAKCLEVDVRATSVDCSVPTACNVVLTRKAGGDEIGGVKLVFKNDSEASSSVIDAPGNIAPLASSTVAGEDSEIASPSSVEVTPYFAIEGEAVLCSQTTTFSF